MNWQYNNDLNNMFMNFNMDSAAYPYSWTSNWGDGIQFNMNSIMTMSPGQAFDFQGINNMVQYGMPMSPFMSLPGIGTCEQFINNGMTRGVAQRSVTTASTLTNVKTELKKMLKKEEVTEEQKAEIQKQIEKVEILEAKVKALQEEMKKGGKWQDFDAQLESILGEKTEIDTKIKEIIDAVAQNNTEDDDDAPAPTTKTQAQAQLKEEYGKNPPAGVTITDDGKFEYKGQKYNTISELKAALAAERPAAAGEVAEEEAAEEEDPAIAAAAAARAATKAEAENNLKTTYGEGKIPSSITVTDEGKFQREVTVMKDGKAEKETKIYDTIEEMQADAKKNIGATKEDAEENLKVVYGEKIPEGMKADPNHPGQVTSEFKDVKDGKLISRIGFASIEELETEMKAAKARVEAYEKAQAEAQVAAQEAAKAKEIADISNMFADAVNGKGTVFGGTNDAKLTEAIGKLNGNNIIEVMDHYLNSEKNKSKGKEDFIEAFEDDADSGQQKELGMKIYQALLDRAVIAGLIDEDGNTSKELAAAFKELKSEFEATFWTNSKDVNNSVRAIVKAIKEAEAAK